MEQADVTPAVEKAGQYVTANGGEVASVDVWGRRALAYPIHKQQEGTYTFLQIQLDPQAIGELERNLKLDEEISAATLFAEAIRRIHNEESISLLFDF